ncbi:MAG: hypothetical protein KF864_13440 [Phycisphaeraceae bacterium]|nr:hypothetical protein [Phycisphaeraceae bacterium]
MDFSEFLSQLPNCPGPGILPVAIENAAGFQYVSQSLPEFIGPNLTHGTQIDQPSAPRVVIISAAGAVGKSTLAREIALRQGAPLWDLAQAAAVGGNSVSGQLSTSFGFSAAAQASDLLRKGEMCLIVDALDEARVKANEAGFEAFVENIAQIAKEAKGPAFVLLARTQTAETTWLLLDALGVEASLVSIQPFTREQAERYIDARIRTFGEAAAKRIAGHRDPFLEARNLILGHLERALGGDQVISGEAAREFLGYAPVLETIAVLLATEGNYQEFASSFKGSIEQKTGVNTNRPLAVLDHVVTRLLDREQTQKLQHNIRPALERVAAEAKWHGWESLYSAREQRLRLLGRILGMKFDACPPLPSSVRDRYEEQLAAWLPEHPFLREGATPANKVFESYLLAGALRDYHHPASRAAEAWVAAANYRPSRLLADFYILLGEQLGRQVVAERQIGILYESLSAGETDSLRVRLSVECGDPEEEDDELNPSEGEFELVYASANSEERDQVDVRHFEIEERDGLIWFRRQLKEASVITNGKVRLGGDIDDFEIGPAVEVRCRELEILATGLVVRAARTKPAASDGVTLESARCESRITSKPLVRGSLRVSWPGAGAFPWTEFSAPLTEDPTDDPRMHEVHRRFRRIVTSLRSHSKGSLARYRDKIEHRRIVKNEGGRALLQRLLDDGILRLDGKFYHWVPERADALLKVSWDDLRNRHVTPELKAYLNRFVADHAHLLGR